MDNFRFRYSWIGRTSWLGLKSNERQRRTIQSNVNEDYLLCLYVSILILICQLCHLPFNHLFSWHWYCEYCSTLNLNYLLIFLANKGHKKCVYLYRKIKFFNSIMKWDWSNYSFRSFFCSVIQIIKRFNMQENFNFSLLWTEFREVYQSHSCQTLGFVFFPSPVL